jgi:hypothetical protein
MYNYRRLHCYPIVLFYLDRVWLVCYCAIILCNSALYSFVIISPISTFKVGRIQPNNQGVSTFQFALLITEKQESDFFLKKKKKDNGARLDTSFVLLIVFCQKINNQISFFGK